MALITVLIIMAVGTGPLSRSASDMDITDMEDTTAMADIMATGATMAMALPLCMAAAVAMGAVTVETSSLNRATIQAEKIFGLNHPGCLWQPVLFPVYRSNFRARGRDLSLFPPQAWRRILPDL